MAMQLKKNGAVLMRDTASLINAAIENIGVKDGLKPGLTFAELMWTDRHLWVITRVVSEKEFYAKRVETRCENYYDGTEYPVKNEDGSLKTYGDETRFRFRYRNWRAGDIAHGYKVHLAFGADTGYRDPSF